MFAYEATKAKSKLQTGNWMVPSNDHEWNNFAIIATTQDGCSRDAVHKRNNAHTAWFMTLNQNHSQVDAIIAVIDSLEKKSQTTMADNLIAKLFSFCEFMTLKSSWNFRELPKISRSYLRLNLSQAPPRRLDNNGTQSLEFSWMELSTVSVSPTRISFIIFASEAVKAKFQRSKSPTTWVSIVLMTRHKKRVEKQLE